MVRIQLASNFQVVELTFDSLKDGDFDAEELNQAIKIVNELGKRVINDIKTAPKSEQKEKEKKEELASEGQVKFLTGLGVKEEEAKKMTKKDAWKYIQEHKSK